MPRMTMQLADAPVVGHAPRRLGAFAHVPVGVHDDFDAPLRGRGRRHVDVIW